MRVTMTHLVGSGIEPTQARQFETPLNAAFERFDIVTPARIAAFIGQCAVESQHFSRLEENLFYRTPERIMKVFPSTVRSLEVAQRLARNPKGLANVVYANKNGNGSPMSGDGWKYRGRGLIQLTGRGNYRDAEVGLGRPYIDQPELVAQPADACLTAAWFWHSKKLNVLADSSLIDEITRAVNGPAMRERDLRRQITEDALRALV